MKKIAPFISLFTGLPWQMFLLFLGLSTFFACTEEANTVMFKKILSEYETTMIPLENKIQLAVFHSYISGKDVDFEMLENLYNKKSRFLSNKTFFSTLSQIRKSGKVNDELLRRQLEVIYNQYQINQIDTNLLFKINQVEQSLVRKFSIYRAEIGKTKLTRNVLDSIFRTSSDPEKIETTWRASKQVGDLVANDLIDLVESKNEMAKKLGFKNYFEQSLSTSGLAIPELEQILIKLDKETKNTYKELKKEFDPLLAKRFGVPVSKLGVSQYQSLFFQTSIDLLPIELEGNYAGKDLVNVVSSFFDGLDLPIDKIISNSDFSEKTGKNQFSTVVNADRAGDVRVLENVRPNSSSMLHLMSSMSQACYFQNIDSTLPFTLRVPSHQSLIVAVGAIFSHFSVDPDWLSEVLGVSEEQSKLITEKAKHKLLVEKVIFARWSLMMYHFEKSLYENPSQNLNKLWWELYYEYLLVKKPERWNQAYWAASPQLLYEPCQFQNYILGDIIASHLYVYMNKNLVLFNNKRTFVENKRIGLFLKNKIFQAGARLSWEDIIKNATGEPINSAYLIKALNK